MISISEINNLSYETSHSKRARYEEEDVGLQRFKGVVPQQNGHWGAQIYANHQRIWLGTFTSEKDAAMAYDSATVKLRSGESHRNFPWNDQTVQEPLFQSHYSMEKVLSMIRNGTYQNKFSTFVMNIQSQRGKESIVGRKNEERFSCMQIFQKELTPSDVGKLNRLVIPKKHAVTYLPLIGDNNNITNDDDDKFNDQEVVFYDKLMRLWKFRYCYWKSSQSYVFTRGWNRFVKDKKLKAKDTIVFYMCEPINSTKEVNGHVFSMIDVIYNDVGDRKKLYFEDENGRNGKLDLGENFICTELDDQKSQGRIDLNVFHAQKGFKLFGVNIN
ncbi:unnamed protein product [Vicia faba]|uniref:Uncharacterized protein n=1 Tax=Vicia faba TaxID=3906 RepID=A0AAV0YFR4_VICFA|nr:unnamed protein product [Vicia faba]